MYQKIVNIHSKGGRFAFFTFAFMLLLSIDINAQNTRTVECKFPKTFDKSIISFQFFDGKKFKNAKPIETNKNSFLLHFSTKDSVLLLKVVLTLIDMDSSSTSSHRLLYTSAKKSKIKFKNFDKKEPHTVLYQYIESENIFESSPIVTKAYQYLDSKILNDTLNAIYSKFRSGITEESLAFYDKKRDFILKKILMNQMEYVKNIPAEFNSLFIFDSITDSYLCVNDSALLSTFTNTMRNFKNTTYYKYIHQKILRSDCINFGTLPDSLIAPDNSIGKTRSTFTAKNVNGTLFNLDQTLGKKVILNFWATWCGPCMQEMPELKAFKKLHPEYAIVGVSWDKNIEIAKKAIDKLGIDWDVVMMDKKIMATYRIQGIPKNIFIDEKGKIFYNRTARLSLPSLLEIVESK